MMNDSNPCEEFELLMQADIDGELDAAEAANVTAHRNQCMRCMVHYKELMGLRERVRERNYQPAGDNFRARLSATLAAARRAAQPPQLAVATAAAPAPLPIRPQFEPAAEPMAVRYPRRPLWRDLGAFAAGGLLAGCLLLPWILRSGAGPDLAGELVADHVRAMQADHLMDVASSDQHNVKPWFEGKVDFAPPVKNLAAQGFPLAGARLDYVNQRTVAVMVYQGGKHPVNLFAWPDTGANNPPTFSTLQGYNIAHWTQDGMSLWAVSDMTVNALAQFTEAWRTQ
jgi:anti-sigma factor RsiW